MGVQVRTKKNGKKSYGVKVSAVIDGERRQVWVGTFDRRKDADAAYIEARRDMNRYGTLRKTEPVSVGALMDKVIDNKVASGCSVNSIIHYRVTSTVIKDYLGSGSLLSSINRERADAFVHYIYGKYKTSTASGIKSFVASSFKSAKRWGYINDNPFDDMPAPRAASIDKSKKKGSALSRDDVERIAIAAPGHMRNLYRVWPLIGLRVGEMRGLRWDDVNLEEKYIDVRYQLDKSGRELVPLKTKSSMRRVYLSGRAVELLSAQRSESECEYVFHTSSRDKPLSCSFNNQVRRHIREAGIDDASPHTFRHTFGSWLLIAGAPLTYIQAQLGHSKLSTTMNIYLHEIDGQRFDPDCIDV